MVQSMSRDLGYTFSPINVMTHNYPKKRDYSLKLRTWLHIRSKNPYVKPSLKILSRRELPGAHSVRGWAQIDLFKYGQFMHHSKGNLMLINIYIRNMVWKTTVQKILDMFCGDVKTSSEG